MRNPGEVDTVNGFSPVAKKRRERAEAMINPAVSVVVPVYNRARTLARALSSILAQTFPDFELIVVDDGSTDDSAGVAEGFGDSRIRVLRHPENRGVAAARNTGIGAARGNYVAFLDSDDEWLPEKLKIQIDALEAEPGTTRLYCTDYFLHRIASGQESVRAPRPLTMTQRDLLWGCGVSPGATLLAPRALFKAVGPFDETLTRFEDWDWLLRCTRRWPLRIVEQPLARVHTGTPPPAKEVEAAAAHLERKHLPEIRRQGWKAVRIFHAALLHERSAASYREGRFAVAAVYLIRSLLQAPLRNREFFSRLWKGVFAPSRLQDILVVVTGLGVGGTEHHLAQVLPRIDRSRFRVRVFALFGAQNTVASLLEKGGIEVIAPPVTDSGRRPSSPVARRLAVVAAAFRLCRFLMKRRPAIIHFFLPMAYLVGGFCSLLLPGAIRVMSRRSLNRYQQKRPWISRIERRLHRRMRAVLGNSKAVLRNLRDEGVGKSQLGLIYNGIDLAPFENLPTKAAARAALGLGESALVLITVANLIPYKGHADLLEALARIAPDLPPGWVLLCVGRDDGIEGRLRKQAKGLGLAGHVRWLGERDDVPRLLGTADIGLLCSHEEGFSNAVLEGMAAGLPMVVTAVGGNNEAVIDGTTGYVVPARAPAALGRAIVDLAAAPGKRAAMGEAGRRRVETEFTIPACVTRYETLYAALLDNAALPVAKALQPETPAGLVPPITR
jgi:glycosyltransferase involved in cell wall biosynthesis